MTTSKDFIKVHQTRMEVIRICREWVEADMGDEPFWEGWAECPSEETLTPNMVLKALMGIHHD